MAAVAGDVRENRPSDAPSVLVVIGDNVVTGPVKGVLQLVAGLRRHPCRVGLANCVIDGADDSAVAAEAQRRDIDVIGLRHSRRDYLGLVRQGRDVARARNASIVQTHGYKQALVGAYLKYRHGLRWICFLHGRTTEDRKAKIYHRFESLIQRLADTTVVVSEAQLHHLGAESTRLRVVPNAVESDRPAPIARGRDAVRATLNVSDDMPLLVVLGRLSPEKGVDVFVTAFGLLAARHDRVHAAIVGDGPLRAALEQQAEGLGLNGRLRFVGHTSAPGDYLLAADALVLPSRSEGMPNAVLEAMAFGRPVVGTRVGGVGEVVAENETGLLVRSDAPEELADAMERVVRDPALAARMGEAGARRVAERFSPAARASAVYRLYVEVQSRA